MFRILASRSALFPVRQLSTTTPTTNTPSTPTTTTSPSNTPPPKPPRSLFRRTLPVAFIGATSYLAYRLSTDHQFRIQFEQLLPSLSPLLSTLPTPPPPAQSSTTLNHTPPDPHHSPPTATPQKSTTLPPGYDSLPHLLQKIDESNLALAHPSHTPDSADTPPHNDHPVHHPTPTPTAEETLPHMKADPGSTLAALGTDTPDVSGGAGASDSHQHVDPSANHQANQETGAGQGGHAVDAGAVGIASDVEPVRATSGKDKLQRLLGKGGFDAAKVEGPDVVDKAVYRKPEMWRRGAEGKSGVSKVENGRRWGGGGKKTEGKEGGEGEVEMLKRELESVAKWEAVRLQEAVRAQLVEDKKEAAKAAALMAKSHAEEMEKIKLEARREMERVLGERTVEIQQRANRERDEDVRRLLKVKEVELRERMAVEYAEKERAEAVERKRDLIETKATVGALLDRFDAVVRQTEKAKEAAKRTSSAFLLKETVDQCVPLGTELKEASDKSELGQLVVDSIPTAVVGGGACSMDRLKIDFGHASRRGLSVAMVPEGRTGTLWGHFLGAVFSRLKIPVEGWGDENDVPKNNEERIRRAGRMVEDGDLGGAIVTLESLNGLSKDLMSDWVGAAKGRVAADQAAEILLAEAIIAQVALTGEEVKAQ